MKKQNAPVSEKLFVPVVPEPPMPPTPRPIRSRSVRFQAAWLLFELGKQVQQIEDPTSCAHIMDAVDNLLEATENLCEARGWEEEFDCGQQLKIRVQEAWEVAQTFGDYLAQAE